MFRLFFIAAIVLFIISGCAATGKQAVSSSGDSVPAAASEKPSEAKASDWPGTDQSAGIPDSDNSSADTAEIVDTIFYDASVESATEDPAALIDLARTLALNGEYAAADSNLKRAVQSIETIESESDTEWFPSSSYIDDIVSIYNEKMPQNFRLPEEIAITQFQKQMVRSLDSLQLMPSESLSIAARTCQRELPYDVPMVWNSRVERAIAYYMKNREKTVDYWIARAPYWVPSMRRIFAENNLPQDLAFLPLIESGFNPYAYSYAHASGLWQFIASTGKLYGLRRTYWIDERRDPIKATAAAASYLKKLYRDFGNWHLALAAYNCGEGGLGRRIRSAGHDDFWKLKLNSQTSSYVPFYLAAVTIFKNPKCFGISMPPADTFALDTALISECINLSDIAEAVGTPLDTLKRMNPHIMHWCTPPDVSNTVLYLPPGQKQAFAAFLEHLPEEKRIRWCRYQIRQGDNIQTISRKFSIPVENIKTINRLTSDRLIVSNWLFLPQQGSVAGTIVAYIPPISANDFSAEQRTTYRVRKGDNLGRIARKFHVSVDKLYRWNNLSRKSKLRIGRVLVVRKAPAVVEPAFTTTPPKTANPVRISDAAADTVISLVNVDSITETLAAPEPAQSVPDTVPPDSTDWMSAIPEVAVKASNDTVRPIPSAVTVRKKPKYHFVKPGENLFRLSLKYSVSLASLREINNLKETDLVRAGDRLVIPASGQAAPPPRVATAGYSYYKVKNGDTMWGIASKFGMPVEKLYECNNMKRSAILVPGRTIRVIKAL